MKPSDKENPENRPIDPRELRLPLAELAVHLGIPKSTLQGIALRAEVKGGDGFPVLATAKAAVTHYKTASETEASEATKDDNRKKKSEADLAELKLGRESGALVEVDEMKRLLTSAIVRYREKIRQLPGLTLEQKKDVMEQLATLTLEEVEE